MDAERQNDQAYENVKPRFVWESEHARSKSPAARGKAKARQKSARPRRRRALLSAFVTVAVLAGGAFAVTQLSGHGDAAKTGSTQAAELGSAEFPQAGLPPASANSDSPRTPAVPTRQPSKTPSRAATSPEPTKSLDPAAVVKASAAPAPKTAASPLLPAATAAAPSTASMPTVVEALSNQWGKCALLNASCSVSLPSVVALGANGYFNYGTFGNATDCSYGVFGNPNASGQIACYSEPTPTASSNVWTVCAAENGTCGFSGVMTVAFGANGNYHYATLGGGGTACTVAVFGDPASGTAKTCYLMAPPPEFTHWDLCATNGGTCKFSRTQEVAYGANGRYRYGSYTNGTSCTASTLGNPEASGTTYCYVQDYYLY